jgi:MATE family multidrug resistance protein
VTVIAQGALLFIVAGGFQLIDGTQATLLGALRGINDVSKPMKYSLISYILFAIPMAYVLGFLLDFGPCGILSGEALGLLLAAILYYQRLRKSVRKIKSC